MIVRFLGLILLFSSLVSGSETLVSKYATPEHEFEIKAVVSWASSYQFSDNTIVIRYSVFKDGEFIHPENIEGGTIIGTAYGSGRCLAEEVSIESMGGVGWIVRVGAIRGNTASDFYTLICPSRTYLDKWNYKHCTFIAKMNPEIRKGGDRFEIWTTYQEWGQTGTAGSFFVPELRVVTKSEGEAIIERGELPENIKEWPKLEFLSPAGIYVAGITQLNPEIMEVVIKSLDDEDNALFEMQGLPTTKEGQEAQIELVRKAKYLKRVTTQFKSNWSERFSGQPVAGGNRAR